LQLHDWNDFIVQLVFYFILVKKKSYKSDAEFKIYRNEEKINSVCEAARGDRHGSGSHLTVKSVIGNKMRVAVVGRNCLHTSGWNKEINLAQPAGVRGVVMYLNHSEFFLKCTTDCNITLP